MLDIVPYVVAMCTGVWLCVVTMLLSLKWMPLPLLGTLIYWVQPLQMSLKSLSLSLSFPLCCIYHLLTCLFHLSLQFRAKLYKLQHPGKELVFSDMKPPVAESEQQGRCGEMNKKGREAVGEGEIRIIFKVLTTIILFCVSRSDGYEHCHSTEGRK